jgi:hypothetical protein
MKLVKTPEERAAAAAKARKDSCAVLCQICKQGFMASASASSLLTHVDSKHPKISPAECFPVLAVLEEQRAREALAAAEQNKSALDASSSASSQGSGCSGGNSGIGEKIIESIAVDVTASPPLPPPPPPPRYRTATVETLQLSFIEAYRSLLASSGEMPMGEEEDETLVPLLESAAEAMETVLEEHQRDGFLDGSAVITGADDGVLPYLSAFLTEEQAAEILALVLAPLAVGGSAVDGAPEAVEV